MNRKSTTSKWLGALMLPAAMAALWLAPVAAEVPVDKYDDQSARIEQLEGYSDEDEVSVEIVILSPDELDDLIGPIALYPDDLLAIVLPASTYPLEIVEAARFLDEHKMDSSLEPNEDWDESVIALLNYPEVVYMMHDDIDWTWKLGGAVLNQQQDVIGAVESFRDRAYAAGNLQSDDYQTVNNEGDTIEIIQADEEIIYVPYYEPRRVVVRQVEPVYFYYPRPHPVYYYPYPAGHSFLNGYFWGVTTAYRIGWSSNYLNVWHYSFLGHPYYGRSYYDRYYRRPSINIYNTWYAHNTSHRSTDRYRRGDRWRPRPDHGVRPHDNDRPRRPGNRDRDQRDRSAIVQTDVLSTQPSNIRPGTNRVRDRNVDLSSRRESPDLRRDRNIATRGQDRDSRPTVSEQNVQRPAKPRSPRDDIRFRERPEPVTANVRPGTQTNNAVSSTPRRPIVSDQNVRPVKPRQPRDGIRFRERPEPVTANVRPGTQTNNAVSNTPRRPIVSDQNVRPVKPRQPRDDIRFRERPATATANVRPGTQTNRGAANTVRSQNRRTASMQASRDSVTTRATETRANVRQPVRRTVDRSPTRPAKPVASTQSNVRRSAPVVRKPARQPNPPAARQDRRQENRASRDVKETRPARSETKERKAEKKSEQASKRRKERR